MQLDKLSLSKLQVCGRQLETAVDLFFKKGDPVSIHTLTCAAYNVLRDINGARSGASMWVKERYLEQTTHLKLRDLNAPENFFKHADSKYADNDHTTTLDFYPIYTECLLVEACEKYYEFTGHRIEAFDHFKMWFASRGPEFFDEVSPPLKDVAAKVKELRAKDDRQGFLELLRQTSFTDLLGG